MHTVEIEYWAGVYNKLKPFIKVSACNTWLGWMRQGPTPTFEEFLRLKDSSPPPRGRYLPASIVTLSSPRG